MARVLIVEDNRPTAQQLSILLRESCPAWKVDTAETVSKAIERVEQLVAVREEYVVAILDFVLPKGVGEHAEMDETVCETIMKAMPDTMILHVTAYPEDPRVSRHLRQHLDVLGTQKPALISKVPLDWPERVVDLSCGHVFGSEIREDMQRLSEGTQFLRHAATDVIARLQGRLSQHWRFLDDALKETVRERFSVDETHDPVKVSLF